MTSTTHLTSHFYTKGYEGVLIFPTIALLC